MQYVHVPISHDKCICCVYINALREKSTRIQILVSILDLRTFAHHHYILTPIELTEFYLSRILGWDGISNKPAKYIRLHEYVAWEKSFISQGAKEINYQTSFLINIFRTISYYLPFFLLPPQSFFCIVLIHRSTASKIFICFFGQRALGILFQANLELRILFPHFKAFASIFKIMIATSLSAVVTSVFFSYITEEK